MAKKYYVFTILLVLIGLITSSAIAQYPEQRIPKWKVVSVYPANVPIFNNGIEKFARDVKTVSNGQLDIQVFAAREPIADINKPLEPYDVFKAVSEGTVEIGFGNSAYWAEDKIPGSEFMYSIPFGLSAKDMYAWLYRGGGLELWREIYAPFNIIPFPVGDTGGAMGGWFKKKIEKISDFYGMNIRTSGFTAQVYQKLGTNIKWLIAIEALDAYNKGNIEAIILQGPYTDQNYRFYQGPKYYYYPGWQEPCGILSIIINRKAWEKLPANLQKTIETVCGNTYQYISNQSDSMNSIALKELQKEGVMLKEFPPEVLGEFRRLSTEVLEDEAKKSAQFDRIYRAFKKFKEGNVDSGWNKIVYGADYAETTASKLIEGLGNSRVANARQAGNNSLVITLSGDISFASWAFQPTPALSAEITRIAKIISDYSLSIKSIRVEGHSATDGSDCSNWEISKKRANAVSELLIDNGIDKSLIKVIAYGEDYPIIFPDDTEQKRSINRRVEIVIEF
ncbi:MAG: phosphate ABC transporter substrate-binding/OmpA family protein [Candidatus Aminicenantes bacterium]|nr:phosphate ABC transporter substrate-binding/OmpA family protein [Candidatus Aminicenantes bacterium]